MFISKYKASFAWRAGWLQKGSERVSPRKVTKKGVKLKFVRGEKTHVCPSRAPRPEAPWEATSRCFQAPLGVSNNYSPQFLIFHPESIERKSVAMGSEDFWFLARLQRRRRFDKPCN
jgi:hypothetical protein